MAAVATLVKALGGAPRIGLNSPLVANSTLGGLAVAFQTIAVLANSKDSDDGWLQLERGGKRSPLLRHSMHGDILGCIIELLRIRMERGLTTIFVKIRAHRGEFLDEKADRWADE